MSLLEAEIVYRNRKITDFCPVPVTDARTGQTYGLVLESTECLPLLKKVPEKYQPRAVQVGPIEKTENLKPRSMYMGNKLYSWSEDENFFKAMVNYVYPLAEEILKYPAKTSHAAYLVLKARKIVEEYSFSQDVEVRNEHPLKQFQGYFINRLQDFMQGKASGRSILQKSKVWESINSSLPMAVYAVHTDEILRRQDWLEGDVLEFGADMGLLSRHISRVSGRYVRTYRDRLYIPHLAPEEYQWDINEAPKFPRKKFDTIIGVNALQYAVYPIDTLRCIRKMLRPGGRVVITEVEGGTSWPLEIIYGLDPERAKRGGVIKPRKQWFAYLLNAGFKNPGYSIFSSGRYDLGGVLWATT